MTNTNKEKAMSTVADRATPRPWSLNVWTTGRRTIEQYDKDFKSGHPIAEVHAMHNGEQEANAELIVRAVNNHVRLVFNLEQAKECIESLGRQLEQYHVPAWQYKQTLEHITNALNKAKGN